MLPIAAAILAAIYLVGPLTRHLRGAGRALLVLGAILFASILLSAAIDSPLRLMLVLLAASMFWALLVGLGTRLWILRAEGADSVPTRSTPVKVVTGLIVSLFPLLTIL